MYELYCTDTNLLPINQDKPQCKTQWKRNLKNERAKREQAAEDLSAERPTAMKATAPIDFAPDDDEDSDLPPEPPRYRRQPIIHGREIHEPPRLAHAEHKSPFRRPKRGERGPYPWEREL